MKEKVVTAEEIDTACENHDGGIEFWCRCCGSPLCKGSLVNNHKVCNWDLIENKSAELDDLLKELIASVRLNFASKFANSMSIVKVRETRSNDAIKQFEKFKNDLDAHSNTLLTLQATINRNIVYIEDSAQNQPIEDVHQLLANIALIKETEGQKIPPVPGMNIADLDFSDHV